MQPERENSTRMDDCYYFLYSTCTKGDQCPFRHCELAIKAIEECPMYASGQCLNEKCPLKHSTFHLQKNRKEIYCYWETHGGCTKPHCAFKHTKDKDVSLTQNPKQDSNTTEAIPNDVRKEMKMSSHLPYESVLDNSRTPILPLHSRNANIAYPLLPTPQLNESMSASPKNPTFLEKMDTFLFNEKEKIDKQRPWATTEVEVRTFGSDREDKLGKNVSSLSKISEEKVLVPSPTKPNLSSISQPNFSVKSFEEIMREKKMKKMEESTFQSLNEQNEQTKLPEMKKSVKVITTSLVTKPDGMVKSENVAKQLKVSNISLESKDQKTPATAITGMKRKTTENMIPQPSIVKKSNPHHGSATSELVDDDLKEFEKELGVNISKDASAQEPHPINNEYDEDELDKQMAEMEKLLT